jgi:hypothetical protein
MGGSASPSDDDTNSVGFSRLSELGQKLRGSVSRNYLLEYRNPELL